MSNTCIIDIISVLHNLSFNGIINITNNINVFHIMIVVSNQEPYEYYEYL